MSRLPRPSAPAPLAAAPLLLLLACAGDKDDSGGPGAACTAGPPAAGTAEATIQGEAWTGAGAAWTAAGQGVQVTTETANGWRLTLVASSALAAVDAGELPVEVALDGSGEGLATVYPESGASATARSGGLLVLQQLEADVLSGCFSFTADGADGEVTVDGGTFAANPL